MKTSKSPLVILKVAYRVAKVSLPKYSHPKSPRLYTQPQLLACLVLKEFLKLDYRGLVAALADSPSWRRAIGLRRVPHYSTLQRASGRLLSKPGMTSLLDSLVAMAVENGLVEKRVKRAAVDSTGFETRHVSPYFVRRRNAHKNVRQDVTYHRYPSLGAIVDCKSHVILAAVPGHGPKPDIMHFREVTMKAARRVKIGSLLGDKAYDAEWAHSFTRKQLGGRLITPVRLNLGPRSKKSLKGDPPRPPGGPHRRALWQRFPRKPYGQRWQVETVNSMLKRHLGASLRARKLWTQRKELALRVVTHNTMII